MVQTLSLTSISFIQMVQGWYKFSFRTNSIQYYTEDALQVFKMTSVFVKKEGQGKNTVVHSFYLTFLSKTECHSSTLLLPYRPFIIIKTIVAVNIKNII